MKNIYFVIIHLLFWVTIVIVPFFTMGFGGFKGTPENYYFMIQHGFNAVVFYLAYSFTIPLILKNRKPWRILIYSISFILALALLRFLINPFVREYLGAFHRFPPSMGRQIFYALNWTILFSFYAVIIYLSIEWFKERKIRYELAKAKQQSEIDLLKSQVNPHFLMNTLNNLYSLVYQGSRQASDAVLKLSDLMRYMLYDTQADYVSLEIEIKYLNSFIELQLLRLPNKELVDFEIVGDPSGKLIAPMLLVPFVENAFKHGNKNLPGMGISIRMQIEEGNFLFEVENIKASKSLQKIAESGIGLKNIQKRLELIYPDRHELEINESIDTFNIRLKLTL